MRKAGALLSDSPGTPRARRGPGLVMLAVGLALVACGMPTSFKGEPKVPGGRVGCEEKCRLLGMELAGMVLMGDYSDGCVCRVPGAAPPASAAPAPAATPSAAQQAATAPLEAGAAIAAGAVMSVRAQDERRRQQVDEQRRQFWKR